MKVTYSWILPIKNEAQSLPQLIKEITQAMQTVIPHQNRYGIHKYEIIAVNDASTDQSLTTLKSLAVPPRRPPFGSEPQGRRPGGSIRILSFHSPQGKWAALRAGFKAAQGQIIITSDSDLQDNPKEVIKLLRLAIPIRDRHSYDLVSGARINRFDPLYKVIISKAGNLLASFLTGYRFHDLNSPFKIYKREVLENIPQEGSLLRFSTLFARKLGYKVAEVPIIHRPRLYGKSKFGVVKYLRIIYDLILILLLFSGSGKIRNRIKIKK